MLHVIQYIFKIVSLKSLIGFITKETKKEKEKKKYKEREKGKSESRIKIHYQGERGGEVERRRDQSRKIYRQSPVKSPDIKTS